MELDKYMADVGFTEQLIATLLAELLHQNKQDLAYFVEKSLEASFSEGGKVDKTGAWSESMTEFSEAVAGYENMLKIFNSISSLS